MNVAKLGKKGQVTIPEAVLEALRLEGERWLLVETTADGVIVLRPAGLVALAGRGACALVASPLAIREAERNLRAQATAATTRAAVHTIARP